MRSLQLSVSPSNGGSANVIAGSDPLSAAVALYMSRRFIVNRLRHPTNADSLPLVGGCDFSSLVEDTCVHRDV